MACKYALVDGGELYQIKDPQVPQCSECGKFVQVFVRGENAVPYLFWACRECTDEELISKYKIHFVDLDVVKFDKWQAKKSK
jgi:hypothetical protein